MQLDLTTAKGDMALFAMFRYAIGRDTGAMIDIRNLLWDHAAEMTPEQCQKICQEIIDEMNRDLNRLCLTTKGQWLELAEKLDIYEYERRMRHMA